MAFSYVLIITCLLAINGVSHVHRHGHRHLHRSWSCDFGIRDPHIFSASQIEQWCSKIALDVVTLKGGEHHAATMAKIKQLYAQADVNADPASAVPSVDQIVQDPQAYAALQAMKKAYSETGSRDLTRGEIAIIYSDALSAAAAATDVPTGILVEMIWTESKGHPLGYNGLTQMDYIAWGQMVDREPQLTNRYLPTSNIVAAAMYLADVKERHGCTWESCYYDHYRYPDLRGKM